MFVGIAQMAFALAGIALVLEHGLTETSLSFVGAATLLTLTSRWLYRRK